MKVIQFKAEWCGPCRQQTKEFEEHPLQDVEFQAIDIDEDEDEEDLTTQYKVMSLPTIILLKDNDIIKKWVGLTQVSEIQEVINNNK